MANDEDLDSFLRGPSDQLNFPAPAPNPGSHLQPQLTRIDTATAKRWPTTAEVQTARSTRGRSASPRRSRKGLVVRFKDEQPEIIGEGGEEADEPTISLRNRASSHPGAFPVVEQKPPSYAFDGGNNFRPAQIRRTQTGYESITDVRGSSEEQRAPRDDTRQSGNLDAEQNRMSFAEKVKADMREGEGKALLHAGDTGDIPHPISQESQQQEPPSIAVPEIEIVPQMNELQINTLKNANMTAPTPSPPLETHSPHPLPRLPTTPEMRSPSSYTGVYAPTSNPGSRRGTINSLTESATSNSRAPSLNGAGESPKPLLRSATVVVQEAVLAAGDDALRDFSTRSRHLFTLFRLSSESVQPLSRASLEDLMRVALWWFLRGRMNLEATIRDRPNGPDAQQASYLVRQQAYADLAKSIWIIEEVIPQYHGNIPSSPSNDPNFREVAETQQGIMSTMRKLTMSMKRNNLLPPEDAPLPQGLDPAIWTHEEGSSSLLASQRQGIVMGTIDAMPLGDTSRAFHFARSFGRGTLIEEGASQQYQCPVLVSLGRDPREKTLSMIITNQSGTLRVFVQGDKSRGPTWEHVTWQAKTSSIDLKLPRGFILRLECPQNDFRTLLGVHDYEMRIHGNLQQRRDEIVVFDSTLRAFQHFGGTSFPKEPLPNCQLRLFEKVIINKAATGVRKMHRGFRIAVVTNPSNKNLRGISQDLLPSLPIQFGFLRGEDSLPAFLLKIDDGTQKYTMVFTFADGNDRAILHSRLSGTRLDTSEAVIATTPIATFGVTDHAFGAKDASCLKNMACQTVSIINIEEVDVQNTKCVLSDHLRVVLDFKTGSITDRINVGSGELRIRLDVKSMTEIKVLRQRQVDMTMCVLESQVSKDLPSELAELLAAIAMSETTRTYAFPSLKDLHVFQSSLTGFSVIFDGMAASLNISRRRMVVPIYKKWEAISTRLQIVKREKVIQLLGFFENFSHGDCMNFTLKSTDVFESSGKSGKYSLRIVDAKFSLPRGTDDATAGIGKAFVSLDEPDYPGEHDDITIVFDREDGMILAGFFGPYLILY